MLIVVKSKRFSVTGYKRMFVILIIKTLGSGFKYSTFDYCVLAAKSLSFYEVIFFSVVFIILYLDSLRPYTSVFGANLNVVIFSQPARWST